MAKLRLPGVSASTFDAVRINRAVMVPTRHACALWGPSLALTARLVVDYGLPKSQAAAGDPRVSEARTVCVPERDLMDGMRTVLMLFPDVDIHAAPGFHMFKTGWRTVKIRRNR